MGSIRNPPRRRRQPARYRPSRRRYHAGSSIDGIRSAAAITFLLVLIIDFNQVGRQFGLVEGVAVSEPFSNCAAARAVGADPVYRHEAGYGPHLDGDNDGIGCEPPRR
jgi:hypothetical protein